jgi:hypothetical protein
MGDSMIDWSLTRDVPDVLVPPDVTLRFAPGAVLVPLNYEGQVARSPHVTMEGRLRENHLVRIEIQGAIIADMREIFAANVYPFEDRATYPEEPWLPAGKILLTGHRIREVYPEWWGAFSALEGRWSTRHVRALQAAINAGHTDRHRPRRTPLGNLVRGPQGIEWVQLPTIPVVAAYNYPLAGPLRVGKTEEVMVSDDAALQVPNPAPFVLRGERETSQLGKSTFLADRPFNQPTHESYQAALLHVAGSPFVIEKVHFRGEQRADTLVRVEVADGGHHEFNGCVFEEIRLGEGATAVRLESPPRRIDEQTGKAPPARAAQLSFTRCRIVALSPNRFDREVRDDDPIPPVADRRYPARMSGVSIDVEDHVGVVFTNCFIFGLADPLIRAYRGRFSLNGCTFHAVRTQQVVAPSEGMGDAVRRLLNSSDGTDIYIEAPGVSGGQLWAPASFTARAIESQSYQFLASFHDPTGPSLGGLLAPPPTGGLSAVVLLNVKHAAAYAKATDGGVDDEPFVRGLMRPSIAWDGPALDGAMLVATGCSFRWDYRTATTPERPWFASMGGIMVGPGARGKIYHLGNTLFSWRGAGGDHVVPVGPMGRLSAVRPERLIAVASAGASTQVHALPYFTLSVR